MIGWYLWSLATVVVVAVAFVTHGIGAALGMWAAALARAVVERAITGWIGEEATR